MRVPLEVIFEKFGQDAFFSEVESQVAENDVALYSVFVPNSHGKTLFLFKPLAGATLALNDKFEALTSILDASSELGFSNQIKGKSQSGAKFSQWQIIKTSVKRKVFESVLRNYFNI